MPAPGAHLSDPAPRAGLAGPKSDVSAFAALHTDCQRLHVLTHHFHCQFAYGRLVMPAKPCARLARIPEKKVDLCRAEILRIHLDEAAPRLAAEAFFVDTGSAPVKQEPRLFERPFHKGADLCRLAGCENIVVGRVLLQHPPHALDIFLRMAPVALGVQIPEVQPVPLAKLDRGNGPRDLAGHESLAAQWTFMVEQDAVRGMQAVRSEERRVG